MSDADKQSEKDSPTRTGGDIQTREGSQSERSKAEENVYRTGGDVQTREGGKGGDQSGSSSDSEVTRGGS